MPEGLPNSIDRSLKELVRRAPGAFLRLLGIDADSARPADVSVNLPEYRADQVFLIGPDDAPDRWALHLEYQLQADPRELRGWFLKNAGLTAQLQMPVLLAVIYLTRGGRRSFPKRYRAEAGGLTNEFRFHTIHLWEHAARIRSGELAELAPLLVLCEDEPTVETLFEERDLIRALEAPRERKADLLGLALTVAARRFDMRLLADIFREELEMIREATFVDEWIREAAEKAAEEATEKATVETEGRATRAFLIRQLRARFGSLPQSVETHISELDAEACYELGERLMGAETLKELGLADG